MWKCKHCGGEVLRFNLVVEAYRIDENYDEIEREESCDGSLDKSYYECIDCGENDKGRETNIDDLMEWKD